MTAVSRRASASRRWSDIWEIRIAGAAWRFFSSLKLALVLILALAIVVLVGTLVSQVPPTVQADPAAYDQWLDRVRGRYGAWTDLMAELQVFSIFRSLFFRILVGLLTVNIVVCTMNRWRGIWVTVFRSRVRMSDAFFKHARFNATFAVNAPPPEAARLLKRSLSRARYRVSLDPAEGSVALLGDKNRLSPFGTFLTHLSIVLILAGAVIGGMFGFKDPEFVIAEGATRQLVGTDLAVRLEHFADEYYLDGPPKDFRSEVTLFDKGQEVRQATIRVNSPMRYKGIVFHQAFYGQTAIVRVEDASGKVLYKEGVPLAWRTRDGGRPVGGFTLPAQNLSVWIIGPRSGENDPLVPPGEMRVELYRSDLRVGMPENLVQGRPEELAGLTFTFERESRFTGLKVVKDPGVNLIWIASALMILGMIALFYMPRRRVWAICREGADGTTEVSLAMPAQRDQSLSGEFERLRSRVVRALGARGTGGSDPGKEGNDA